ncbi:hypothetical protein Taro_033803, partial [Colocasia esculenta]|nr:hypothetical protein [Colocasia esculenta]
SWHNSSQPSALSQKSAAAVSFGGLQCIDISSDKKRQVILWSLPKLMLFAMVGYRINIRSYEACGLIHTIRGQHIAALDSYMKDSDEPFYAFAFVLEILLKLNDSESSTFRSAVMSRIPELVKLSREDTFLLVIDQFNKESQQIMSQLQSHPQSLFLFLKTVIDVHLHGTLNFPILGDSQISDVLLGRIKDGYAELGTYLNRISNFTKLLQQNPFNVDDKAAELYLELKISLALIRGILIVQLLCQFERGSVLRFLETFDNYRLEHCLRLCQEYHVNDAAAFLLERVGDVGSALELIMSGLGEKFSLLATAVEEALSDTSSRSLCFMELLDRSLKMDEACHLCPRNVSSVFDTLHSAIGLCQRNTQRLDPLESELLWFRLLDSYCEPLRELYDHKEIAPDVQIRSMLNQKFRELGRGAGLLRSILSQFIKEIVEGMVGYVPLPAIMGKLLAENGGQEFGDFKLTLLGLLGTYGYERRILGTAKLLIEDDTFYTMSLLRKGVSHAYAPQGLVCCLCGYSLAKVSSSSSIRVFNCGHATHLHCEPQENGVLDRDSSAGCPVCMPKRKTFPPRSKSILMENRLIRNSESKMTKGSSSVYHLHEPEATERSHGNSQMSRVNMALLLQFEILSNLQEAQKLLQVDPLPQLRLAPPSIYHEKVQKGTDILQRENSNPLRNEKPNKNRQIWDSKPKGFSKRFPLKTNIFGLACKHVVKDFTGSGLLWMRTSYQMSSKAVRESVPISPIRPCFIKHHSGLQVKRGAELEVRTEIGFVVTQGRGVGRHQWEGGAAGRGERRGCASGRAGRRQWEGGTTPGRGRQGGEGDVDDADEICSDVVRGDWRERRRDAMTMRGEGDIDGRTGRPTEARGGAAPVGGKGGANGRAGQYRGEGAREARTTLMTPTRSVATWSVESEKRDVVKARSEGGADGRKGRPAGRGVGRRRWEGRAASRGEGWGGASGRAGRLRGEGVREARATLTRSTATPRQRGAKATTMGEWGGK